MVDTPAPSNQTAPQTSNAGAMIGWGLLGIATLGFIWFVVTQLGAGWEGRETEAQEIVQNYKSPEMKYSLKDQLIEFGNQARAKGRFVGTFAWSTTQDEGPLYRVSLIWKEDSATQKATWMVDLQDGSIKPEGKQAEQFMKPPA